jgi:hypothetical protein
VVGEVEEGWGPRTFFQNIHAKANGAHSLGVYKFHCSLEAKAVKEKLRRELVEKAPEHVYTALKAIPAVLLGCLLNILDGVSCECSVLMLSPLLNFFHCLAFYFLFISFFLLVRAWSALFYFATQIVGYF